MAIGQTLREAREAKKLSLAEVASAIRVNKKYLQALEEGNYLLLHSQVFAKGFLKSYASYLGLEPKDLMPELISYYKSIEESKKSTLLNKRKANVNYGQYLNYIVAGAIVFIVLVLIVFASFHIKRTIVTHPPASPFEPEKVAIKKEAPNVKKVMPPAKAATVKKEDQVKLVEIKLEAIKRSKVNVWVNNKMTFDGSFDPGDIKTFTGKHIRVRADNGGAIKITRDGVPYGAMGGDSETVEQNYGSSL